MDLPAQMLLDRRPFAFSDAVDTGVTHGAVACVLMIPQVAVQLFAQPLDSAPALLFEEVGAEFDCDPAHFLERMRDQQQLALCVEGSSLHARRSPGRADFQTM